MKFLPVALRRPLLLLLLLPCLCARAASPEWESPPVSHKDVLPYFDATALYTRVLPPPPAPGSPADERDVATVTAYQSVEAARRAEAEQDSRWLYDRFESTLGAGPLQRAQHPALVQLLNRSIRQVSRPAFAAKRVHARERPYQRLQLAQVCGSRGASAAASDADAQERTSYPSGHAAYGWTTALVLARVRPERAEALLARAQAYAESRLICGMHFPSDVEASRQLATAVVTELDRHPEFQQDLQRARAELAAAR